MRGPLKRGPLKIPMVLHTISGEVGVTRGGQEVAGGVDDWGAASSRSFSYSNHHVDRCPNPLPWDLLSSP